MNKPIKRKKKSVPPLIQTGIKVRYDTFTEVTRECDSEDEWDMDDTHEHHSNFKFTEDDKYPDLVCPFKLVEGQDYYFVNVIYDTGCSFNVETGKISLIGIYQTGEEATKAVELIEAHHKIYESINNYTLGKSKVKAPKGFSEYQLSIHNNGVMQSHYVNWHGYFERFTCANIETFTYQKNDYSVHMDI